MKNIKVLGSGSPILDVLLKVDDSFLTSFVSGEKGGMNMIDIAEQQRILRKANEMGIRAKYAIGGSSFNTISALTHLGLATAFLGKTGKDADGEFFRKAYKEIGGDSSSLKETSGAATANCICLVTPDSQRTMRSNLGASTLIDLKDISSRDFCNITHVHIEGYQLFFADVVKKVITLAKENHCTVSFDMASFEVVRLFRRELQELLPLIDIIFANEDEAGEFFAEDTEFSPECALEKLAQVCPVAVVKVGAKGAWIREKEEIIHVDARMVEAVDTTGAGDLWQAGFLYGYLTGKGIEFAGCLGSAVSAEVVQVLGAELPEEAWGRLKKEFGINEQTHQ